MRIIKSLMILPFVPRIWTRQLFTTMIMMNNGELPAIAELLQYIKDTWLNCNYSIAMWNMVYKNNCAQTIFLFEIVPVIK